jgi:uncharacterized membrane protein YsdA (DUF1294 family)
MAHRTRTAAGALPATLVHHAAVPVLSRPWAIAVAVAIAWNLVTWAVYRLDKARARRQQWRFRERTLLGMAALGGSPGALLAVYVHRQRHKAQKLGFVVPLWAIAAIHAGLLAAGGWRALQ